MQKSYGEIWINEEWMIFTNPEFDFPETIIPPNITKIQLELNLNEKNK